MAGSAISLTITADDRTAKTIAAINANLTKFAGNAQANMNKVGALTQSRMAQATASLRRYGDGIARVSGSMQGLARAGGDAFQKVGQVVPLIGIIGSAASIAGITRMVTAWADWGTRVGFTAQRIGISTDKLSALQGAARLAGSSAESAASGLQTLGQTMYDAIGGRAPEAIVMFRTLGIAFQDASGHARSVTEVLPEVADKIRAIRDPFAQAQVATALFGGAAEDLLPFLRKGSAGIRELTETSRRYGVFSDQSAAAANRLREAQARVTLAVEGLSNRIAERLEPILTPMLTHFAEWLATSPQVAAGVEWLGQEVDQLGRFLEGPGLAQFVDTLKGWGTSVATVTDALGGPQRVIEVLMAFMGASFALKVIGPFLTLGGAIVTATRNLGTLTTGMARLPGGGIGRGINPLLLAGPVGIALGAVTGDGSAAQPGDLGKSLPLLQQLSEWFNGTADSPSWFNGGGGRALGGLFGGGTAPNGVPRAGGFGAPGGPTQYLGAGSQGSGNERNIRNNNPTNLNFVGQAGAVSDGRFAHFKNMESGVAADLNQFLLYQDRDHVQSIAAMINKATPASDNNPGVPDYIKRVAAQMGMQPGDTPNLHDPAIAAKFIMAVSPNEGGTPDKAAVDRGVALRLGIPGPGGAPLTPPAAQGAPMTLNTGGGNDNSAKPNDSTVRLHISGDDRYRANVVGNPAAVPVSGPLVERPALLGAMP
jgi:hypothetical protein